MISPVVILRVACPVAAFKLRAIRLRILLRPHGKNAIAGTNSTSVYGRKPNRSRLSIGMVTCPLLVTLTVRMLLSEGLPVTSIMTRRDYYLADFSTQSMKAFGPPAR